MTFFDEFKRNASDVAGKAAKKTNELTNIAKLNVSIKSCESKLGTVYEEIGRMFYMAERTGDDYTSEIAASIMKADKIKSDISAYKAKIAQLKRIIVCDACGNEIPDEFAFCSYCGAKVIKPEPETEPETSDDIMEAAEEITETEEASDENVTDEAAPVSENSADAE